MRKLIYSFLSFIFIFSFAFSSQAARELSLGCFEGYAEQEWIDEVAFKDVFIKVKLFRRVAVVLASVSLLISITWGSYFNLKTIFF